MMPKLWMDMYPLRMTWLPNFRPVFSEFCVVFWALAGVERELEHLSSLIGNNHARKVKLKSNHVRLVAIETTRDR